MIQTENQHWIPRFLLKNFADNDGRVYRLNVADDKIAKLPPRFAAARPNFNELLVGGEPRSFEDDFERLETAAAPVIAKTVKARTLQNVTPSERDSLAKFVAAQTFRTEAYRVGLGGHNLDIGSVVEQHLSDLEALAGLIERRRWALMVTEADRPFYLGDNPVVLQSTERPSASGKIGLDVAGIEVMMPLSPQCALYMPCPSTSQEIVTGYWNSLRIVMASLAGHDLPDFDMTTALSVAHRALGSAGPLYRALMYGEPLVANEGNVENLNYLQCVWASSGVFSGRRDFSFALRVLRENPSYRKAMPVSLATVW